MVLNFGQIRNDIQFETYKFSLELNASLGIARSEERRVGKECVP